MEHVTRRLELCTLDEDSLKRMHLSPLPDAQFHMHTTLVAPLARPMELNDGLLRKLADLDVATLMSRSGPRLGASVGAGRGRDSVMHTDGAPTGPVVGPCMLMGSCPGGGSVRPEACPK